MPGPQDYEFKYVKQNENEMEIEIADILTEKGDCELSKIEALKKDNRSVKEFNNMIEKYNQFREDICQYLKIINEKLNQETPKTGIAMLDSEKDNITQLQQKIREYRNSLNKIDEEIKELEQKIKACKDKSQRKQLKKELKSKKQLRREIFKIIKDIKITLRGLKSAAVFLTGVASFKTIDHTIEHVVILLNEAFSIINEGLSEINKLNKNKPLFFINLNSYIGKLKKVFKKILRYLARLQAMATKEVLVDTIEKVEKLDAELTTVATLSLGKLIKIIEAIKTSKSLKKIFLLFNNNVKKVKNIREDLKTQIEILCKKYGITKKEAVNSVFCAALVWIYLEITKDKDLHSVFILASESNINRNGAIMVFGAAIGLIGCFVTIGSALTLNLAGMFVGAAMMAGGVVTEYGGAGAVDAARMEYNSSGSLGVGNKDNILSDEKKIKHEGALTDKGTEDKTENKNSDEGLPNEQIVQEILQEN